MIKLRELNLRTIRKMTMRNRLQAINEVNRSALSFTMFSMMTPTQFAELFPRYYREHNPDIQGFMNALPTSLTAAQQKAREQQLAQTASGSAAGSDFNARGYVQEYKDQMTRERSAHVGGRGGRGGPPPATLSPEQDKAFSYVQSGDMDVGSDIMKNNLGKLSTEELSSIGITKITKEGKEYYHYNKPEMTREQAIEELKKGSSTTEKILDVISGHESGGKNVKTNVAGQSASGHFQFTDGTWRGLTSKFGIGREYSSAMNAPAEVQRAVAKKYVEDILARHHGDVSWVPREWYGGPKGYLTQHELDVNNGYTMEQYISRWMGRYGKSGSYNEGPKGPDGQYSDDQIKDAMKRYAESTVQSQKQKYAEILQKHGVDPQKVQTAYDSGVRFEGRAISNFKVDSGGWVQPASRDVHIQPGNERQCVTLSRAFNNDLPNVGIGGWKVSRNDAAIQPGVVVATNMYNSGRASAPKQGFHTGVALTRPNENGDFWMLDQSSGGPAKVRLQNVNNYNYHGNRPDIKGNFFGIVNGNTKQSREAIAMALNNPGNMPREAIEQLRKDYDNIINNPKVAAESDSKEIQQVSKRPESHTVPKDVQEKIPEGAHVTFDQKTGRVEQKTETKVTVSEKKPETAKPEPPKPEAPKPPEGSHVTTDVKSNRVEQKPEVKKTVTPAPEKKADVPPPDHPGQGRAGRSGHEGGANSDGSGKAGADGKSDQTAKVEPPKPEPQKVAEAKPTEKPKTPVPTAAKGGKFNADADTLRIEPIGGLTKDGMTDTAVLMSGDRPVSTLNPNRETVTTKNNQVSIQPVGKESKLNPPPQPQNSTPDNLATAPVPKPQATPNRAPDNSRDATMVNDLLEMSKPIFRNVSSMRAFSRANFEETGSAIDWNHHSLGTPNLK